MHTAGGENYYDRVLKSCRPKDKVQERISFLEKRVEELEKATSDATQLKGWFQNKLLRIFLVFIFSSLGSVFGTWAGGAKLISSIF